MEPFSPVRRLSIFQERVIVPRRRVELGLLVLRAGHVHDTFENLRAGELIFGSRQPPTGVTPAVLWTEHTNLTKLIGQQGCERLGVDRFY